MFSLFQAYYLTYKLADGNNPQIRSVQYNQCGATRGSGPVAGPSASVLAETLRVAKAQSERVSRRADLVAEVLQLFRAC